MKDLEKIEIFMGNSAWVDDEKMIYDGDELSDFCGRHELDFFEAKTLLEDYGYEEI